VLFQLPPSLNFDDEPATRFFGAWRGWFSGATVCEPRHESWFGADADRCLSRNLIARAAVDPALCAHAAEPGGYVTTPYFRLHGSPDIYRSAYGAERLDVWLDALAAAPAAWCILDNTQFGAAAKDALILTGLAADAGVDRSPAREAAPI
jgi:uncharacterized protein YecE (DUF72 family)